MISLNAYISRTLSDALGRREPSELSAFELGTVHGIRPRPGIDLDRPRALDIEEDAERFKDPHR